MNKSSQTVLSTLLIVGSVTALAVILWNSGREETTQPPSEDSSVSKTAHKDPTRGTLNSTNDESGGPAIRNHAPAEASLGAGSKKTAQGTDGAELGSRQPEWIDPARRAPNNAKQVFPESLEERHAFVALALKPRAKVYAENANDLKAELRSTLPTDLPKSEMSKAEAMISEIADGQFAWRLELDQAIESEILKGDIHTRKKARKNRNDCVGALSQVIQNPLWGNQPVTVTARYRVDLDKHPRVRAAYRTYMKSKSEFGAYAQQTQTKKKQGK